MKPRPVARCTKCGKAYYDAININGRCGQKIDRKRCTGGVSSTLNEADWTPCPTCSGTGGTNGGACHCDNGWVYARR